MSSATAACEPFFLLQLAGRYELSSVPLPSFRPWLADKFGLDVKFERDPQGLEEVDFPEGVSNDEFVALVEGYAVLQVPKLSTQPCA